MPTTLTDLLPVSTLPRRCPLLDMQSSNSLGDGGNEAKADLFWVSPQRHLSKMTDILLSTCTNAGSLILCLVGQAGVKWISQPYLLILHIGVDLIVSRLQPKGQ